jgi:predicted nucleotidyltransferase
MDKQEIINKLKEYIDIIQQYFNLKLVIFYGSYSNNTQTVNSDIDVAIFIEKDKDIDYYNSVVELFKLRENIDYRIEPNLFFYSESGYENASLENYIINNGIILYRR